MVHPGDRLVAAQTLGEPTELLAELFSDLAGTPDIELFAGMSLTGVLSEAPPGMALRSFVGLGANSSLIGAGRMSLVPCHMSDLPWMLREGPLRPDVALVTVSPPDSHGACSLGLVADYARTAVDTARVVLAEVNERVPRIAGDTSIPFERISASIRTARELPEQPVVQPTETERAIAAHIAPHVADGSCLQVGVGRLGEAVLQAVAERRDLGVHSGMIGDTILQMVEEGTVTNERKSIDRGVTVAGSVLGSRRAVQMAARNDRLEIRSIDYTNALSVLTQLRDVVCINSAIEVDLLGQVNSELAEGRYVGAVGGAVDFLRGAVRSGGRAMVALPATAKGGTVSRIVSSVGCVSALRSDVDMVVTEYGCADLRGVSEGERAIRLVGIAAPQHRDMLRAAMKKGGL